MCITYLVVTQEHVEGMVGKGLWVVQRAVQHYQHILWHLSAQGVLVQDTQWQTWVVSVWYRGSTRYDIQVVLNHIR